MIKNSTISMYTEVPEVLYDRVVAKVLEGEESVSDFVAAAIERVLDESLSGEGMHVITQIYGDTFAVHDRAGNPPMVYRNGKSSRQRLFSSVEVAAFAAATGGQWFYKDRLYGKDEILGALLNG